MRSLNLLKFAMLTACVGFLPCFSRAADSITQTLRLQPGWNAVWIEVEPATTLISTVFNGVPIESVWTFQNRLSTVEFIQDPSEPVWNRSEWLVHFPTNRAEAFQNTLFHVSAQRAYLIQLAGSSGVDVNIAGRPSPWRGEWQPDAYNLRGYPIDPAGTPTFADFFKPSSAHYSSASSTLEPIYRLGASGQWERVGATDRLQRGAAYWTFCRGNSDYVAPLALALPVGGEVDFGETTADLSIGLRNLQFASRSVVSADAIPNPPLSYATVSLDQGTLWNAITGPVTNSVASGAIGSLRLGIRRSAMTSPTYASVIEIRDSAGVLHFVPVTAQRGLLGDASVPRAALASGTSRNIRLHAPDLTDPKTHAGLWLGSLTLNAVAAVHSGPVVTNTVTNAVGMVSYELQRPEVNFTPTRTASDFNMRLILHVDTNGTTRLLKEVVQMATTEITARNDDGSLRVIEPAREVLVMDERLASNFQGMALRDGGEFARRVSTAGFDFPAASTNNFLALTGNFGVGQSLEGAIILDPGFATHPFRHKYHPDHDNLGTDFKTFRPEAPQIQRSFSLQFGGAPAGNQNLDYGFDQIVGAYQETISGLHRTNLVVKGTFSLRRVSRVGILNQ